LINEDHRSVHQTVVRAIEIYLALRETAEVKADPATLRALAEAREGVRQGDVVYGTEAVRALIAGHRAGAESPTTDRATCRFRSGIEG
jgi:hypothetical protein